MALEIRDLGLKKGTRNVVQKMLQNSPTFSLSNEI